MNDYKNFTEYVVKPEMTAKIKLARVLLISAYTVFTAVYLFIFWVLLEGVALLILLPFILFAIVKLTWRFTCPEYEYIIEAGELLVAVIYGGAARRVKCRVSLPDATLIAPFDNERERVLNAPDISDVKRYCASEKNDNAYICVYPAKNGSKKRALIFDTTPEAQRIMRICNPSAFISSGR